MEKIELMHHVYGKGPEKAVCWNCHFCHWKIEGKGDSRRIAYRWCEVYGLNKDDITETDWQWGYPACGFYNADHDAPIRKVRSMAGKEVIKQLGLFDEQKEERKT